AVKLGIYEPLRASCGHETRWIGTKRRRDLMATSGSGHGCLNFSHSDMQQKLLDLAVDAGAELRRPAEVIRVNPGSPPSIMVRVGDTVDTIRARLVVGADGRRSNVRAWAGFQVKRDPDCSIITGALHHGLDLPEDTVQAYFNPDDQQRGVVIP